MIRIEKTTDLSLIEEFLFDPEMKKAFDPDDVFKKGNPKILNSKIEVYIAYWDKTAAVIFFIYPLKNQAAAVHIGIKDGFRGRKGYLLTKALKKFCFENKKLGAVVARVKKTNKKCLYFCQHFGMRIFGGNDLYKYLEVTKNGWAY